MTNQPDLDAASQKDAARSGGVGCLAGLAIAIGLPAIVFCGILIANAMNPRCGTPSDSGGCEMGLAAGTMSAIVIGLGLGTVVAIFATIAGRTSHRGAPPKGDLDVQ
jgi:hypothetical protein